MKSIFEVKLDRDGYHGLDIHHENMIESKDGVANPYAYNLAIEYILRALIRMQFSEDDKCAVEMLDILEKRAEDLMDKFKITSDKYGIHD